MSSASTKPPLSPAHRLEPPKPAQQAPTVTAPWKSWHGVVFVLIAFFGAQIVGGSILSLYPLLQGWSSAETSVWFEDAIAATVGFVLLTDAVLLLAIYLFVGRHKTGFAAIGLRKPQWSDLGWGFSAVIPYFAIYLVVIAIVTQLIPGFDVNQEQQTGFDNVQGALPLLLTFACLVVLPPIIEEILVRGVLYSSLRKAMPIAAAAVLTSILFGVIHLPGGGAAGPLYVAAVDTFVLSMVMIYLREKTGGLWASMVLHGIKNGIAFTVLFALQLS